MQVERSGDKAAAVGYEARDVRPDRDFDLYYSVSTDAIAVNLLSYKPFDEDGYFLLLVTPPVEAQGAGGGQGRRAGARHVGQHGRREDEPGQGRGEVRAGQPGPARPLQHRRVQHGHPAVRRQAGPGQPARRPGRDFVDKLQAAGSTDINRALLEAIAGADSARPTVVIFLTDGLPTAGETDPDHIVANVGEDAPKSVRLFCFRRRL